MKKTVCFLMIILSVFALMFTSCRNEVSVEAEGTLVISIAGGQSRGLLPTVSMNVAQYSLTVTNSSGEEVARKSLDAGTTSMSYRLPAGTYTVRIDALNNEGTVIGSGETSATVTAGGTNSVTVTIRELEGNGVFAVSISANDGYELTLKLYNPAGEEVYTGDLVYAGGRYVTDGQVVLGNGFYGFSIFRNDTGAVVKSDSIRIVKDYTTTYSAEFTFQSDGSLAIINEMVDIPTIKITLEKSVLGVEDNLEAVAEVSGISDYTACWLIDGVPVGAFGEYADLSQAVEGLEEGEHEVALCVRNSQVMWAENKVFTIKNNGPIQIDISTLSANQWIAMDPDAEYSFVNMNDSSLYAIEIAGDGSRSLSLARGIGKIANILDTGKDRLLVPDENRTNSGSGASYIADAVDGLIRIFQISIANPNFSGDMSIVFNEEDFSADACDEWNARERNKAVVGAQRTQFYHVNFLAPAFSGLDRSRIFMVVETSGGRNMGGTNWGIVTLGNGIKMGRYPTMYMYDFSNVPFINIYHEFEAYFTQDRWEQFAGRPERRNGISSVVLLNPVDLSYDRSVGFVSGDRIFSIPQPSDDSDYVLVSSGCNPGEMIQLTDRDGKDYGFAYCLDSTAENKEYLLGKITKEVFFDLGRGQEESGSFSIRKATSEDKIEALELDSPEGVYETSITFSESSRDFSLTLPVFSKDDFVPSNLIVSISVSDEQGNVAELDNVKYSFRSAHSNGVGYSNESYKTEPCIAHRVRGSDILKYITVNLRKNINEGESTVFLRIEISDGNGVFMAGVWSEYEEEFDVPTSGLANKGFFIDMETGEPLELEKNDLFWFVVEESAYDSGETLGAALGAVIDPQNGLVVTEGIEVEDTDFYPIRSKTGLRLEVYTNGSGTSNEDKNLYFIYAKYIGEGAADFSSIACNDSEKLEVLACRKLKFLKGKVY